MKLLAIDPNSCTAHLGGGEFVNCDSPIQRDVVEMVAAGLRRNDITFWLEYRLERYRYDIAIKREGLPLLLIECDGREFHSKPEQIENDLAKTRLALDRGYRLLRFTGRDIYNRPNLVFDDIMRELELA